MKDNIIDADYEDIDTREYFTIEEVSAKLSVDISQIIFWSNKFDEYLKINSIGQFKIFNKEDIRNLKTIKELNIDKKMSVSEIKNFLNQNNSAIVLRKENELSLSIFDYFKNIIDTQNKKMDKMLELQNKAFKLFSQLYNEISIDSLEKNRTLNQILEEQSNQNQKTEQLEKNINAIKNQFDEKEMEYYKQDEERMDILKRNMEEMKKKFEEQEKENKKGLWNRLLGRKK